MLLGRRFSHWALSQSMERRWTGSASNRQLEPSPCLCVYACLCLCEGIAYLAGTPLPHLKPPLTIQSMKKIHRDFVISSNLLHWKEQDTEHTGRHVIFIKLVLSTLSNFPFFKSKKKNNNFKLLRAGRIVRCISVGVCVLQTLNWCALMTVVCIRVWFWGDRVFFVLHEAFHLGSWSHLTLHRGRKCSVGQKFKNVWKKKPKGLFYVTPTTCTASTAGRVELGCERLGRVTRSPLLDLG